MDFTQKETHSNEDLKPPIHISLRKLTLTKNVFTIKIVVSLLHQQSFTVSGMRLRLRTQPEKTIIIPIKELKPKKQNRQTVIAQFNITELPLEQFYWDFYVDIIVGNNNKSEIRVVCDNYIIIKKLRHLMYKYTYLDAVGYMRYPYITVNGGLSITYRKKGNYETLTNKVNEYAAYFFYHCFYRFLNKKIWLVHEKFSETAQDNAFYFFKYCYENHPDKLVYYVIKEDSADYKKTMPYKDRVLSFMSFKHLLLLLASKVIISSEAKGHGYAWRVSRGVIRQVLNAKNYVFLQHGVLGLKKVDSTFNYLSGNSAEVFIVSSEFEKNIVKNYFGYPESHIFVTGLARWDYLVDKSNAKPENERAILLMPTWRSWLEEVEESQFLSSDYYKAYSELLNSERLGKLLETYSIYLNFYVHPKFMPYVQQFSSMHKNVKVIKFGEKSLNELLMEADLLITDYSSVAWEMVYQKKPVLFYHFDLNKYMNLQGSYLNLRDNLIGRATYTADELMVQIERYAVNSFKEEEKFSNKRAQHFTYIDKNNSERIFNVISQKESQFGTFSFSVRKIAKNSELLKTLWRRYKYFPLVRRFGGKFIDKKASD